MKIFIFLHKYRYICKDCLPSLELPCCGHKVVLLCNQVLKMSLRPISHCSQLKEDTVPYCFLWRLWDLQSCYTVYPIILGQMMSFILLTQSHTRACIMYRHTELLQGESPLLSLFTWKPEMFFFFFFAIWRVKWIYFDTESITISWVHQAYFKSFKDMQHLF